MQLLSQHLAIFELELELFAVERRIILVDDAMVVRTDDNDVRGVVVLRTSFSNDQSTVFCNMNPLS